MGEGGRVRGSAGFDTQYKGLLLLCMISIGSGCVTGDDFSMLSFTLC